MIDLQLAVWGADRNINRNATETSYRSRRLGTLTAKMLEAETFGSKDNRPEGTSYALKALAVKRKQTMQGAGYCNLMHRNNKDAHKYLHLRLQSFLLKQRNELVRALSQAEKQAEDSSKLCAAAKASLMKVEFEVYDEYVEEDSTCCALCRNDLEDQVDVGVDPNEVGVQLCGQCGRNPGMGPCGMHFHFGCLKKARLRDPSMFPWWEHIDQFGLGDDNDERDFDENGDEVERDRNGWAPCCHLCVTAQEKIEEARKLYENAFQTYESEQTVLQFARQALEEYEALADDPERLDQVQNQRPTVHSFPEFLTKKGPCALPGAVYTVAQRKTVTKNAALANWDRRAEGILSQAYADGDMDRANKVLIHPGPLLDTNQKAIYKASKSTSITFFKEETQDLPFVERNPLFRKANVIGIDLAMYFFTLKKGRMSAAQRTFRGLATEFVDRLWQTLHGLQHKVVVCLCGDVKSLVFEGKKFTQAQRRTTGRSSSSVVLPMPLRSDGEAAFDQEVFKNQNEFVRVITSAPGRDFLLYAISEEIRRRLVASCLADADQSSPNLTPCNRVIIMDGLTANGYDRDDRPVDGPSPQSMTRTLFIGANGVVSDNTVANTHGEGEGEIKMMRYAVKAKTHCAEYLKNDQGERYGYRSCTNG